MLWQELRTAIRSTQRDHLRNILPLGCCPTDAAGCMKPIARNH